MMKKIIKWVSIALIHRAGSYLPQLRITSLIVVLTPIYIASEDIPHGKEVGGRL